MDMKNENTTIVWIGPFFNRFPYYYFFSINTLKNDLLSVLSIEQSFSGAVKLVIFVYQEILACTSDEIKCVMSAWYKNISTTIIARCQLF